MARNTLVRFFIAALSVLLCLAGIWSAAASGLSRLLSKYARAANVLAAADQAVRLTASDPEAHYARALALRNQGMLADATKELEYAVSLRPRDYVFWYQLSLARDVAGDSEGAIKACEESVRLAPYYGRTHWLLGNLLFRAGRIEDAFTELRLSAASNVEYLPNLIDLAWNTYKDDTRAVEAAVRPQTNAVRVSLAKFFLKQGKISEALTLYRQAGALPDKDRQALITDLLAAKKFDAAYEIWSSGRGADTAVQRGKQDSAIIDGDFEGRLSLKGNAFGWQVASDLPTVKVSLDQDKPHAGGQSLRLDWNGNAPPQSVIVSQLVLAKGGTKYRLRFSARTEGIVSAGLPLISISDVSTDANKILAQSEPFPPSAAQWRDYTLEFTTVDSTEALLIRLERKGCPGAVCPIFGSLWLDDFSLEKLQ